MVSAERVVAHSLERGALRQLLRLLLESVIAGALVSLVLGLAVFIVATQAQAAPATKADIELGTPLLREDVGGKAAAPLPPPWRRRVQRSNRSARSSA